MDKRCFLFGHSNSSFCLLSPIQVAVERHYEQWGIRTFVVGNHGSLDQMATTAVKRLKQVHPDVRLLLLLSQHPAECPVKLDMGFDGSIYPPLERVPRQFCLLRANQYMVRTADSIICHACQPGNSRNLWQLATKRKDIPIDNLA